MKKKSSADKQKSRQIQNTAIINMNKVNIGW